jgi:hypothetical protein
LHRQGARRILFPAARYKETAVRPSHRTGAILAAAAVALGACTTGPSQTPLGADSATCVQLFQWYDTVKASMSTPSGRADKMAIPPALQWPVQRLQGAGCMTMTADLAPMATVSRPPVAAGGPAIAPTSLHAGVVTNMADEANAVAFFQAHGVAVRTVGAAGLGRRIYLGPFATQGALDQARDLAVAAGFASPYPVRPF